MSPINPLRLDPTRTTTERKILMAEMARRCASLRKAIYDLIVTEDAFGISAQAATEAARAGQSALTSVVHTTSLDMVLNTKFMFDTDEKKVAAYQEWFKNEVKAGLLEVDAANADTPWLSKNIKGAYKKGALRAYMDANKGKGDNLDFLTGGKAQFMKNAFDGPVAEGKMRALYTRSFTQLKNVTAQMDADMSRILAQGLAQGKSAAAVAKDLAANVSGLEKKRCMTIARTEIVHAHNEGQLDAFEEMNMEGVGVMAEWSTAHDGLVCPQCAPMEGVVLTIKEARGILPRHPNCRCAWIPGNIGEHKGGTVKRRWAGPEQGLEAPGTLPTGKTTGQTFSKVHVEIAFRDSIKAEFPKLGIKEARQATKWRGAEKSITGKLNPGSKKALAEAEAKKAAKQAALAAKKAEAEAAKQATSAAHGDKVKLGMMKKKYGLDAGDLEALDGETMALTDAGLDKYASKFNIKLTGEEKLLVFDTPAPTDGTLFLSAQMDKANEVIQAAVVKAEEADKIAVAAAKAEAKIAKAAEKAAAEATAKAEAAHAAKLAQEAADKASAEATALKAAQDAAEAAKLANIDTKTADVKAAMAKWSKETPPSVDVIDAGDFSGIPGWENAAGAQNKQSYGVVLFDDEGRVLLRRPTDDIHTGKPFGGASWTFAKGGGYKPALTATTEVGEEVGEIAGIHDIIPGTFKGTTGQTNYFVGRSMGYDASLLDVNPETAAVKWVKFDEAVKLINESEDLTVRKRDLAVLNAAYDVAKNSDGAVFKGIVDAGNAKLGLTQVVEAAPVPAPAKVAKVTKAAAKADTAPAPVIKWKPTDYNSDGSLSQVALDKGLVKAGFTPDEIFSIDSDINAMAMSLVEKDTDHTYNDRVDQIIAKHLAKKQAAPVPAPAEVGVLLDGDFNANGFPTYYKMKLKLEQLGFTETEIDDLDTAILASTDGLPAENVKAIATAKINAAVKLKGVPVPGDAPSFVVGFDDLPVGPGYPPITEGKVINAIIQGYKGPETEHLILFDDFLEFTGIIDPGELQDKNLWKTVNKFKQMQAENDPKLWDVPVATPAPVGTVWEPGDILKNGSISHKALSKKLQEVYGFNESEAFDMSIAFSKATGGASASKTPEAFDAWVKTPRFLNKLPAPKPPEPVSLLWEAGDFQPNGLVKMDVMTKKLTSVGYTEAQVFDIDNEIMGASIGLGPEKTKEIALVKLHAAVNAKVDTAAISNSSSLDIAKFFEWKNATFIDDVPDTKVALDLHNITLLPKAEQAPALKNLVNKYEAEYTFKSGPAFNPNYFFDAPPQVIVPTPPPGAVASFDFLDPKKPKLSEIKKGLGLGTNGAAQNDLYDEFLEWGGWVGLDEIPKDDIVTTINQFKMYKAQLPPAPAPAPIPIPDHISWYKGDTFSNGTLKGVAINQKLAGYGFTPDEISGFYGYVQAKNGNVFMNPGQFNKLFKEYKGGLPGGIPTPVTPPVGIKAVVWAESDFYPDGEIKFAWVSDKLKDAGFTSGEVDGIVKAAKQAAPTMEDMPATLKKLVADAQTAKAGAAPTPSFGTTPIQWEADDFHTGGAIKSDKVKPKLTAAGFTEDEAAKLVNKVTYDANGLASVPADLKKAVADAQMAKAFPEAGIKSILAPTAPVPAPPSSVYKSVWAPGSTLKSGVLKKGAVTHKIANDFGFSTAQAKKHADAFFSAPFNKAPSGFDEWAASTFPAAGAKKVPTPAFVAPVAPTAAPVAAPVAASKVDIKAALKAGISIPGPVQTHPGDKYFETVLKAAKTVNHHAGDKAYNTGTLAQYATTMDEIKGKLAAGGLDDKTKAMLEYYVKWSEGIDSAKAAGTVFPEAYTTPKYTFQTIYKTPGAGDIVPVEGAGFKDAATFEDLGALGGSTGARKVKVKDGDTVTQWAMKDYSGRDLQAENEFFANSIYNAVSPGSAPISRLGYIKNRNGETSAAVFNKFVEGGTEIGKTTGAIRTAAEKTARENFVLDSWLANWDTVGLGGDNMMVLPNGKVVRIDNGGSLLFRAQGGLKGNDFGPKVGELETFLDPNKNLSASKLYKGITQREIANQIEHLESAVQQAGGISGFMRKAGLDAITDEARRKEIHDTLGKRYLHLQEVRDKIEGLTRIPLEQRYARLSEVQPVKINKATVSLKDEANDLLNKTVPSIPKSEVDLVTKWTGNSYTDMREEHMEVVRKGGTYSKAVKKINDGLSKMAGFKGILGRGQTNVPLDQWNKWKRGEWAQVWWTAPSSSSANPENVFGSYSEGVCYIIRSKGNRNGWVQAISRHRDEHEALFMGDSAFRVVGWAEGGNHPKHKRFLIVDELDAGETAPEIQTAPPQFDPTELWNAFKNDAVRAEMPDYGGSATGQGINDLMESKGVHRL